jgi:cytosine/adenosine deaminase-related metal-dependent hydrolase
MFDFFMLLRARTVLPICAPPIDDGAVLIFGERILKVGRWIDLRSFNTEETVDLGDSVLLPGLINAHCHLDYTDMAGQLTAGTHFSDWIKAIIARKAEWSYADFAMSWLHGAKMLLHSGTTTVVDIEAVPELLPDVIQSTPLRVISCLELLSVRSKQSGRQLVEDAVETLRPLKTNCAGLSPHAPYSTTPGLLRAAAAAARDEGWLLTTHVAESADEFEMYGNASGAMFDWLKSQRDMSDCGDCSPVAHLARHDALAPNFLAVHANYLAPGDAQLLACSGSGVVHCPRSHAFFRHDPFPLMELEQAGVNICLGTDSLGTIRKSRTEPLALNMFSEMRAFAKTFPSMKPERILRAATLDAAKALNRGGELGLISPNALADLIALPFSGSKLDAPEAVVEHRDDVLASMIRGEWAINPPGA